MWPRISNIIADDNLFNGGSIQEDTPISEESIKRRKTPSVDVQVLGIGGNVNTRLSTGGHDMVPTIVVPVSRIFDRFRNMPLNSLRSDYMSHAGRSSRIRRIKLWWKWRYLVPVESIHSPMLTLNVFNQRHHDNQKTYNTASATLIRTSLDLLLLLWKARIPFEGKGRQGGDGGACKLLGCLLGDVIEVLEVIEVLGC
ncbi:hypothetical protein Tco_1067436 [Tanacetum coccineum]|uniref:Uncharacterized protein n=1 Tax=Tanacetum coccineum TaxID=301880 RepID=A0ABQ5HCV2_9ASTR